MLFISSFAAGVQNIFNQLDDQLDLNLIGELTHFFLSIFFLIFVVVQIFSLHLRWMSRLILGRSSMLEISINRVSMNQPSNSTASVRFFPSWTMNSVDGRSSPEILPSRLRSFSTIFCWKSANTTIPSSIEWTRRPIKRIRRSTTSK